MLGDNLPRAKVKVGKSFWVCHVCEGKVWFDEWVCRSIQKRSVDKLRLGSVVTYAYLINKVPGLTWGKQSTKSGDYGWEKSIPDYCRRKLRVKDGTIALFRIHTTKLQAAKAELKRCEETLKGSLAYKAKIVPEDMSEEDRQEMEDDIAEDRKNVRAAKANLTRVRNAGKKNG